MNTNFKGLSTITKWRDYASRGWRPFEAIQFENLDLGRIDCFMRATKPSIAVSEINDNLCLQ
jgi:hypothetical protein